LTDRITGALKRVGGTVAASNRPTYRSRRLRGQSLVEFAVALPILVLLSVGTIELGRAYAASVVATDAARDGARVAAGKTGISNGPGLAAICKQVTADLSGLTTTVTCPKQIAHAPPFVSGADYIPPSGGSALVAIYCGSSGDCMGTGGTFYGTEVDVYVYYGFDDANLLGGGIPLSGSSKETTSW